MSSVTRLLDDFKRNLGSLWSPTAPTSGRLATANCDIPLGAPATSDACNVFVTPDALAINEARLCHLASLGLDLAGKRVLEVGGGIGLHTCFFESLGCDVLFTDAQESNLQEARRRFPHRVIRLLNLDAEDDLRSLGTFDIVYCYGTLYHLTDPSRAIRMLSEICTGMILLETCVTPGDNDQLHPETEPAAVANQAFTGVGCRPTRTWVMRELRKRMGFAYQTVTQPDHHDFEGNWLQPSIRKVYRAIFVGSKAPIPNSQLSDTPCQLQTSTPISTSGIWFDVGAHQGESTFEKARVSPDLEVFAFEPNVALAEKTFNRLSNYHMLPIAIGEHPGVSRFVMNSCLAASSLLPMDETARREWIGGEQLSQEAHTFVPTMRLDAVMGALGIRHIDFLKIDAQGADFAVVRSASCRLSDIRKVKLKVTVKSRQLYVGAGTKSDIVRYMKENGFMLVCEEAQTNGQEENLTFIQPGPWPQDQRGEPPFRMDQEDGEIKLALARLSDAELLRIASYCSAPAFMRRVPNWKFGKFMEDQSTACRFRRVVCDAFRDRRLMDPVVFRWYDDLRLNLHLGNDISLPTYVSGTIDPNEFYLLHLLLEERMTFLDIGANEGFYSVFAASRGGKAGRVIAFEPSERECVRLTRNLELNGLTNVVLERVGIADADGEAVLRLCEYGHEGQNTLGAFAYQIEQAGSQNVRLRSLDAYLDEHPVDRVDVVKVDVEGAEERVLRGAIRTLQRHRPILLLEINSRSLEFQGSSPRNVATVLREAGYRIYSFAAATGTLFPCDDGPYSENVVAVPTEKIHVIERLQTC